MENSTAHIKLPGHGNIILAAALAGVLLWGFVGSALSSETHVPAGHAAAPHGGNTTMTLKESTPVIDLSTLKTLGNVIENASDKKIVYVGEYHNQYAHHLVELAIIKGLYRRNAGIAIGMEMFQRPFQKALDEYIAGTIDEREMLKQTEYFKRWVFDYNLYKPILDFARAEKIPVIALNARREIVDKVSKGGLDSLSSEEKKEIPQQMDLSDTVYRKRLKEAFNEHKGAARKNFEFFYQAQILWDETMALSITEYLNKNPDQRMVVLAGSGHLSYGSGIPKRAFRRNGLPYTIILNDSDVERGIADYIVMPEEVEGVGAPMLMVELKVENSRVFVIGMPPDSVSRKAGVRKGDVILSCDGTPIKSVADLRLELAFKKKGDIVKIRVLRKRFLFGNRELEINVKL